MPEYEIPKMDGLYLRYIGGTGPTEPFLRLDYDRGSEAIYIYFHSSASLPESAVAVIDDRVQSAIDDFFPHLEKINLLWDVYEKCKAEVGLLDIAKAGFGRSKTINARTAIKAKCEDLDKVAALYSGSGLRIDLNYQLEMRHSKEAPT